LVLAYFVVRADGVTTDVELRETSRLLSAAGRRDALAAAMWEDLSKRDLSANLARLNRALRSKDGEARYLSDVRRTLRRRLSRDEYQSFLIAMWQMMVELAEVDGITTDEAAVLETFRHGFGLSRRRVRRVLRLHAAGRRILRQH
jgi:hypothetical protein